MDQLRYAKELLKGNLITEEEYNRVVKKYEEMNTPVELKPGTAGYVVEEFKDWLSKSTKSEATIVTYISVTKGFLGYLYNESAKKISNHTFTEFSASDINDYYLNLFKNSKGKTSSSLTKARQVIPQFATFLNETYGWGIKKEEIYDINLIISTMMNRKREIDYITTEELDEIVSHVGARCAAMILITYEGCLKRNELLNMRISDLDMENHTFIVRNKDGSVNRTVSGSKRLFGILKQHLELLDDDIERSNEKRLKANKPLREKSDWLFQTQRSDSPSVFHIEYVLKSDIKVYLKKKGISKEEIDRIVSKYKTENIRQSRILYYYKKGYSQSKVDKLTGGIDKMYAANYIEQAEKLPDDKL